MRNSRRGWKSGRMTRWCVLLTLGALAAAGPAGAQTPPPDASGSAPAALDSLEGEREIARRALRDLDRALELLGQATPAGQSAELDAARATLEAAIAARQTALDDEAVGDLRERRNAAQQARDDATRQLLAGAQRFEQVERRVAELRQWAAGAGPRFARRDRPGAEIEIVAPPLPPAANRSRDAWLAQAAALREAEQLETQRDQALRAWWRRGEVEPLYRRADALYKEYDRRAAQAAGETTTAVADARRAVAQHERRLAEQHPVGAELLEARATAAAYADAIQDQIRRFYDARIGEGRTWEVDVPMPPRRGQEQRPARATLWIANPDRPVRGLILAHPPDLGPRVARENRVRLAAAETGLGIVTFSNFDALFDYSEAQQAGQRLQAVLEDLAEVSGHPELPTTAFLTIGHSVSGIFARNVAYWAPQRTIGVVHIKSGNLHQHRPDPSRTLAGVPFLAINGEYEEFGPEGGIQPAYGAQTQWVMIREQLLRWRRDDPDHLVSLVVHPGGGHGGWEPELSRVVEQFIRSAVAARLPEVRPTGPVVCRPIAPRAGWLIDARLDDPQHPPAPVGEYAGPPGEAFRVPDEATARMIHEYHAGRMILPDPTIDSPVPATWP